MKKVVFTGGGTVGHVAVNVALVPEFRKKQYDISYIGSKDGIEKNMIDKISDIDYYPISSGKLRRYFSLENFIDPFRVLKGIIDSLIILRRIKPEFVFSKGGFVSVPVSIAAKLLKIPVFLHESDLTIGLANRIGIKFSNHIFTTFESTADNLPSGKASFVGAVVREDIYRGSKDRAYEFTNFDKNKPVILVMGGSLGSKILNEYIWNNIESLIEKFQIIHLVGKHNVNNSIEKKGYLQFEFLNKELFDILQITDIAISRAGANTIFELLALNIPSILIPLGINQSRGDQIENARYFEKNGFSITVSEEKMKNFSLIDIETFYNNKEKYVKNMIHIKENKHIVSTVEEFYNIIEKRLEINR